MEGLAVHTGLIKGDEDLGALKVWGPRLADEQDYIALAVTYLAGIVGDNIHLMGTDAIKEKKDEIIADNSIMDWSSAGGDIPSFKNLALVFSALYQIEGNKLKELCLRFLIDFLSDKEIWPVVEKLCDELLETDNMKLTEEELESAFGQIGLDALLYNKRSEYLKHLDEVLQFCQ
jgi:hypothetical protein